jgi:DNA-binding NarL/FixJ family response regulator
MEWNAMRTETTENTGRLRFLIADDHPIFADSLRLLLGKKYEVIGIVGDGRELISEAAKLQPDALVVDIGMPLLNGLDAVQRIKEFLPEVKVIFLTMMDDPNMAAAASQVGAIGFVLKQQAATELFAAIDQVLRGKTYITPRLRSFDWVETKSRARQCGTELTPRHRDILQMSAEGLALKEIAARLQLSPKTIEFHKYHIMQKYDLKSTADLVLFAVKQGLISTADRALRATSYDAGTDLKPHRSY